MKTLRLTNCLSEEAIARRAGAFADRADYDILISDTATVLRPNGDVLLTYVAEAIPAALCDLACATFGPMNVSSSNRGLAAGFIDPRAMPGAVVNGTRYRPRRADGLLSRTNHARPAPSGVVGFADRTVRRPLCRMTVLTQRYHAEVTQALPFIQ